MTQLTVKALDPEAPGSFRERRRFTELVNRLGAAQESDNGYEMAMAFQLVEQALMPHLATDDATPVQEALDNLTANEFDALLVRIVSDTVPLGTGANYGGRHGGTLKPYPRGYWCSLWQKNGDRCQKQ